MKHKLKYWVRSLLDLHAHKTLYSKTSYQVFIAVPFVFSFHLLKFLVMPVDPKHLEEPSEQRKEPPSADQSLVYLSPFVAFSLLWPLGRGYLREGLTKRVQKNSLGVCLGVSSFIFLDYYRWVSKREHPHPEHERKEKQVQHKLASLFFQFLLPTATTTLFLYKPILPFFFAPLALWKGARHGMDHVLYKK